jgi:spore cortex formation protein SpoVR/YcgB (stage V sporulation)
MSQIYRAIEDGIVVYDPDSTHGFNDELINYIKLSSPNSDELIFLKSEESSILNLLTKSVIVTSPINLVIETKINIIKYMGLKLSFELNDSILEMENIKTTLKTVNSFWGNSGKRNKIGVVKGGGDLMFFAY